MLPGLKQLTHTIPQRVIFPFYHAVSDEKPIHLKHLYRVKTVNEFNRDLEQLLSVMEPLTMEEAIRAYGNTKVKPGFHLTFDDGLKECFRVIAPILLKKNIPATFFLNSSFINNHTLFHRHKASILVEYLKTGNPVIPQPLLEKYKLGHFSANQLIDYLLRSEYQHNPLLDEIAGACNISFKRYLKEQQPYLTVEEISNLRENGFTIGSHSANHPEFYRLFSTEISFEIENDLQNIDRLTGIKPRYFAYPFTDHFIPDKTIQTTIEQFSLVTFGTAGIKLDKVPGHYQRLCMENTKNRIASSVLFKEIMSFHVKRLIGAHYSDRQKKPLKTSWYRFIPREARYYLRILATRLQTPFYLGKKYTCNVCGLSFRALKSHGQISRRNAKCPNCLSLERTRVLWFYLNNEVFPGLRQNTGCFKVLHFAPETGIKRQMQKMEEMIYVNADIDPLFADVVMDITQIPCANSEFDLVICSHVLGHVDDEPSAIKELFRVLKPGGIAIIMSLINKKSGITYENSSVRSPNDRFLHYSEPDLVRLHGLDLNDRLAKEGFEVEKIDYAQKLGPEISSRYNLGNGEREMIFHCKKPVSDL